MSNGPIHLAVLVSGSGTTLQNLIDEIASARLEAKIALVVASRPGIFAIERAAAAGIPTVVIQRANFNDAQAFSEQIFAACSQAGAELVCLAGWLTLLKLPPEFRGRVMNIHPALLPSFGGRGMYGLHVHQAVIEQHSQITGCTVHFLDDQYDHGPIILQRCCHVIPDDTPQSLAARVFAEEKIAYPEAIRLFHHKRLEINGQSVRILEHPSE